MTHTVSTITNSLKNETAIKVGDVYIICLNKGFSSEKYYQDGKRVVNGMMLASLDNIKKCVESTSLNTHAILCGELVPYSSVSSLMHQKSNIEDIMAKMIEHGDASEIRELVENQCELTDKLATLKTLPVKVTEEWFDVNVELIGYVVDTGSEYIEAALMSTQCKPSSSQLTMYTFHVRNYINYKTKNHLLLRGKNVIIDAVASITNIRVNNDRLYVADSHHRYLIENITVNTPTLKRAREIMAECDAYVEETIALYLDKGRTLNLLKVDDILQAAISELAECTSNRVIKHASIARVLHHLKNINSEIRKVSTNRA